MSCVLTETNISHQAQRNLIVSVAALAELQPDQITAAPAELQPMFAFTSRLIQELRTGSNSVTFSADHLTTSSHMTQLLTVTFKQSRAHSCPHI